MGSGKTSKLGWVSTTIPPRNGLKVERNAVSDSDDEMVSATIPARGGLKGDRLLSSGVSQVTAVSFD